MTIVCLLVRLLYKTSCYDTLILSPKPSAFLPMTKMIYSNLVMTRAVHSFQVKSSSVPWQRMQCNSDWLEKKKIWCKAPCYVLQHLNRGKSGQEVSLRSSHWQYPGDQAAVHGYGGRNDSTFHTPNPVDILFSLSETKFSSQMSSGSRLAPLPQ